MLDIEKSEPEAPLTPRAFIPIAVSMLAVLAAMFAQQLIIDAAQRWRER